MGGAQRSVSFLFSWAPTPGSPECNCVVWQKPRSPENTCTCKTPLCCCTDRSDTTGPCRWCPRTRLCLKGRIKKSVSVVLWRVNSRNNSRCNILRTWQTVPLTGAAEVRLFNTLCNLVIKIRSFHMIFNQTPISCSISHLVYLKSSMPSCCVSAGSNFS